MNWQNSDNLIVRAVGERGYLDKPAGEVLALQVPKMVEEIEELRLLMRGIPTFLHQRFHAAIGDAADYARPLFDSGHAGTADDTRIVDLRSELADITVVVHVMWAALEELAGERFSADAEAFRKAKADAARGVR